MNMYQKIPFVICFGGVLSTYSMYKPAVKELAIIKKFIPYINDINLITRDLDTIENNKLGYPDYSSRTGLIWSDVEVGTGNPSNIIKEYVTEKVTLVNGELQLQTAQSLLAYPETKKIVCTVLLPRIFEQIEYWKKSHDTTFTMPKTMYAQIFFQRCSTSEPMDWHQDPGEDYDPQANYSCVLLLTDQHDLKYGWNGGEFKIRSGLPEDLYEEKDVQTIIPQYNQAIIFNNQKNSHAATAVIPRYKKAQRDLMVITLSDVLPVKK